MAGGYTGRAVFVNLATGVIEEEQLPESIYRNFIGGAGLGVRILYERVKAQIDALGPDNMLGFIPGLLTGTRVAMAPRSVIVAKSPLTGTWGDANVGGSIGHELKSSGFDAVFLTGISTKPVYLLVYDGKAQLKDASHLWGKDTVETRERIRQEIGDRRLSVACIGPSGERLSLIASVIVDDGRAAGRSGLGAVMGAKRLKAIAVRGNRKVGVANPEHFRRLRSLWLQQVRADLQSDPALKIHGTGGTSARTSRYITTGSTPIRNWKSIGKESFPDHQRLTNSISEYLVGRSGCFACPVLCKGIVNLEEGPYQVKDGFRPEYETLAAFGPMCLNSDWESIIKANDICDRYGIDTISAGTVIAFAMECYERGIIGKKETNGIELTWGNAAAIISMLEKVVKREGLGNVLADGVYRGARLLGKAAEQSAIHIHGQEPGMHDPRLTPFRGLASIVDPTPARHMVNIPAAYLEISANPLTQYFEHLGLQHSETRTAGETYAVGTNYGQVFIASGVCYFATIPSKAFPLIEFVSGATGWDFTIGEAITVGRRIQTMRQAFNIREGLSAREFALPVRMAEPPTIGPYVGRSVDFDGLRASYYKAMGWEVETGWPSEQCLTELGLNEIVGVIPRVR